MKYAEEEYARDLHRELARRFAASESESTVSVEGAGVQWCVRAMRGKNRCSIACFDVRGPEYLTSFERDSKEAATGRTPSQPETINATIAWLQNQEVAQLYRQFQFVDRTKRALVAIEASVLALVPELSAAAPSELRHRGWDIYELWFKGPERSTRISFYGRNESPTIECRWDDCELFKFGGHDQEQTALVLKRWLRDEAVPSILRTEVPWIEIGKLADYYERGQSIEGEFIESWESMEQFYQQFDYPFVPAIRDLIESLRKRGYDKLLRAGQSMLSLILSRSRRHGLRQNQQAIIFSFRQDGMDVVHNVGDKQTEFTYSRIEVTPDIDELLRKMASSPID